MSVVPFDEGRRRSSNGRVPPHDLVAEEALLGALLLGADLPDRVRAEDYYKPAHGHIHQAISDLWARGERPDPVVLADHLRANNLLDAVGGPSIFATLQNNTPSIGGAPRYANVVAEKALLRRLIGVASELAELGYQNPDSATPALERAEQLVYGLSSGQRQEATVTSLYELLSDSLTTLERRHSHDEAPGVMTGLADLDRHLGGLGPGVLVCIAGRPAMGKTQAGTVLALNIADDGTPVLFVSAEMSEPQMGQRVLANISNVSLETIRSGNLAEGHWPKISDGVGRWGAHPVYLMSVAGPNLGQIRTAARKLSSRLGRPPVVIVDYLQLLRSPQAENRNNEVAQLSWGLKCLALDLATPVLMLSQLSRGVETRHDKRPLLSDLRDSGAIEQDSDVVIFLYRDEVYNQDSPDRGIAELIVAKNRHGATGVARLRYVAETGRFTNLARGA